MSGSTLPMQPVLILGCGYLGSALASRLVQEAAAVSPSTPILATTTNQARTEELTQLGVTPVVLSLSQTERLRALLADCVVVYLTIAPGGGRHGSHETVYVGGVSQLLAALPGSVELVVYTSSTSVYGQDDGGWVDEDSPTEPTTAAGRTLLEAEQRLLAGCAAKKVSATVLRLTGLWGPGRGPERWVNRIAGSERDDGDGYLNLVHRDDAAEALARLRHRRYHGLLNLNDDAPTPRRALYDPLLVTAGLQPIRWQPGPSGRALGKRVRNTRIKELLDLRLAHPRYVPPR